MPKKSVTPGSSSRVTSKLIYRVKQKTPSKRKGQQVTATYAKRYPHLVQEEKWLYIHTLRVGRDKRTGKERQWWAITSKAKSTEIESITPVKSVKDRNLKDTLTRSKAFQKIWANDQGEIRVTVNGIADGKRVKEVIHMGFIKAAWEAKGIRGYADFKEYVLGGIIGQLRRRGLRLSNPKESAARIRRLQDQKAGLTLKAEYAEGAALDGIMKQIKYAAQAIPQQKKTRQLTKATIKIEKMV